MKHEEKSIQFRRATRDDLIELACTRFLQGEDLNIERLAEELGVSRATAYKWAGNVDQTMALVLASVTRTFFRRASEETRDTGARRIQTILMSVSRSVAGLESYRRMLERNPERVLRIAASKSAPSQAIAISLTEQLLEQEIERGCLHLPFDARTMAYILVRICESFLYADVVADEESDFDKQEIALKALLESGGKPQHVAHSLDPQLARAASATARNKEQR